MPTRLLFRISALLFLLISLATPAAAHEARPVIAELDFGSETRLVLTLDLEAFLSGDANSARYDELRAKTPEALGGLIGPEFAAAFTLEVDGRASPLTLTEIKIPEVGVLSLPRMSVLKFTNDGVRGRTFSWRADPALGPTILRVSEAGVEDLVFAALLSPGAMAGPIAFSGAPLSTGFLDYVVLGFEHIIPKGLDHILFIVGLFLLSARLHALLWQVTCFTLAHSITLALGATGLVSVPPYIVEPLIAASIVYVALENLATDKLRRGRPFVVFGFGLLHGLGFAGVLSELGLPKTNTLIALAGFNIGVEIGQISVLAVCFLLVGFWFRGRSWYRTAIVWPASLAVASVASIWFVERVGWAPWA